MKQPAQSYTIWFSQRTGSTLLGDALSSTGVAGYPNEWLHYQFKSPENLKIEDLEQIWSQGTTSNGVFGIKINFEQRWIDAFRSLYHLPPVLSRAEVWSTGFPNCNKHIYMTRRNKVRLAVSWWRAIVSGSGIASMEIALTYKILQINTTLMRLNICLLRVTCAKLQSKIFCPNQALNR